MTRRIFVITRRGFLGGGAALAAGCAHVPVEHNFRALEHQLGGRIGFSANDIGVAWPPRGQPIILAVYTNAPQAASLADSEAVIAALAASAVQKFGLS